MQRQSSQSSIASMASMGSWGLILALGLLIGGLGSFAPTALAQSDAKEDTVEHPDMAICTTCAARATGHGKEKVAAWREYQGQYYYFCEDGCAKAFDGFPQAYVEHPIPRPAPEITLLTVDSKPVSIGGKDSGVRLLDFWATWCSPCLKAMPKLDKLHRKYADQGFSVIGISLDQDVEKFYDFLKKKKPSYPMVYDNGPTQAWQEFYVAAIPTMILLDAQGQIIGEWKGEPDLKAITKLIESQLAPVSQ